MLLSQASFDAHGTGHWCQHPGRNLPHNMCAQGPVRSALSKSMKQHGQIMTTRLTLTDDLVNISGPSPSSVVSHFTCVSRWIVLGPSPSPRCSCPFLVRIYIRCRTSHPKSSVSSSRHNRPTLDTLPLDSTRETRLALPGTKKPRDKKKSNKQIRNSDRAYLVCAQLSVAPANKIAVAD